MKTTFTLTIHSIQSKYLFTAFFIFLILSSFTIHAQGDLLLYPKRIVFEDSKRSQTINLSNTGNDTVRYLVSVVQSRMKEAGGFETIVVPDSGQFFAVDFFRFYPRNVVLGPKESQSVKIQLTNTGKLDTGEYRSHLYFRAEPDKNPLGEAEVKKDSGSISVNLVAVFGISIPVIIRKGESTSQVTISAVSVEIKKDAPAALHIIFNRTGNMSVYGDITVDHISPEGKITRVAIANGMAIYTPNTKRQFNLKLDHLTGVNYHAGKLRVAYTTQPDAKSVKMAEKELQLN